MKETKAMRNFNELEFVHVEREYDDIFQKEKK